MTEEEAKNQILLETTAMLGIGFGTGGKGGGKKPTTNQATYGKNSTADIGSKGKEGSGKKGQGADNISTYPNLKDDLRKQNLDNIAKQDSRLDAAVKGSGTSNPNFGIGNGTRAEADQLGKIWVGDGARPTSGGGWISADGTRAYRPPSEKRNSSHAATGTQANFETLQPNSRGKMEVIKNGHLNILD